METELKFVFEATALSGLERRLARGTQTPMRACYFDSADDRLASAAIALRLRREGAQWVQTLKARATGPLARLEHECPRGGGAAMPPIDLALHAGTPAGAALAAALGDAALEPIYETDVLRTHRVVRAGGARVEIALDIGELRAGTAVEPIREIEFELLDGPLCGLLETAAQWSLDHDLWLDLRSKSERGMRLARGVRRTAATKAVVPRLAKPMSPEAALRAMVAACIEQVLPNAAELTAGLGTPEHLHQLRVGLRRLRSAFRLLGDFFPEATARWEPALRTLFTAVGEARNLDVLRAELLPALQAAGAPALSLAEVPAVDVGALLRRPGVSLLWLELLAFALEPSPASQPVLRAKGVLDRRLSKLERRLRAEAAGFARFGDAECHRLRKRLKRLRYGLELAAPILPRGHTEVLPTLRPLLDLLGRFNDACQAQDFIQAHAAEPGRAFALGWLAAHRERLRGEAQAALVPWLKLRQDG